MVRTKQNKQTKNLPSATTLAGNGRGTTPRSGSRQTKPTEARKEQLEAENKLTEESIVRVAESLQDVLIDAKLPAASDEIDLDMMEDVTCKAMEKLSVSKVNNMYTRYQLQWKEFVKKKK